MTTSCRPRRIRPGSGPTSAGPWTPRPRGFPPRQRRLREASIRTAHDLDKGHGRIERRTIRATTWLDGYLDWPGVGQVFHLRRERTIGGRTTAEDVYGITSLTAEEASPAKLLRLIRSHWAIENTLHGVRDGTLQEDASRVRAGSAPQVAAGLRNLSLFLLRRRARRRKQGVADAIRHLRFNPLKAVELVTSGGRE